MRTYLRSAGPCLGLRPLLLPSVLALPILFSGCGEESPPPLPEDVPPTSQVEEDVRGIELVASGWEPPWRMEIERGGELTLTPVYGMDAIRTPAPDPVRDEAAGITEYTAEFEDFQIFVQVRHEECQDPREVELYEATVHIRLDGELLAGCGTWGVGEPDDPVREDDLPEIRVPADTGGTENP